MDSNNLATLFAPNILHSMKAGPGDGTMSPDNNFKAAERTETINIVRTLIDFNKELFELCWEDLHSLYVRYCVLYCTVLYTDLHSMSGCTRTCPRPWTTSSAAERCSTETSMSSVFVVKYFSPFKIFLPHIHVTSGSWRSSRAALSTTCPSQDSSVLTWSHPPSITVKKGNFKLSTLLCQL